MRYFTVLILGLFFFCNSCQSTQTPDKLTVESKTISKRRQKLIVDHPTFISWIDYYKKMDSELALTDFELSDSTIINYEEGRVAGSFDKEFNFPYAKLFIYNKSWSKYLDLDSYSGLYTENGEWSFGEPDQAIHLVDTEKKTVKEVAFYGPSFWVEDAFWIDEFSFVLLQNSDVGELTITFYNTLKNTKLTYTSKRRINQRSEYSLNRIQRKLVNPAEQQNSKKTFTN